MNLELEKYFMANEDASYIMKNGQRSLVSVDGRNKIRVKQAKEQARNKPVSAFEVFEYVDKFLDMLIQDTLNKNTIAAKQIVLDGKEHKIINNGIIVKDCVWEDPIWNNKIKRYTFHDKKYDVIKDMFSLKYANDIIWLKFTKDGYVGVVADSFDINFNYTNSSGKLLKMLNPEKFWDDSFVYIFPLTKELLNRYKRKSIETAIGNFLLEKGIPIIDYYSHNNFTD
jgi:hypothetical protein